MVTYRHQIWWRNFQSFKESKEYETIKVILLFILILAIVLLFIMKISATINTGIEAQKRTDKIAAEVKALEKENKNLMYQRDLFKSEAEIEAQYRILENKKKEGEKVVLISRLNQNNNTSADNEESSNIEATKEKVPNWQQWLELLFD